MSLSTLHLLDCTMFWSPTSGGVQRYLSAKRAWLRAQGDVEHSIVAPSAQPGLIDCGGVPLPRSGGYRFPLRVGALSRQLQALRPNAIEAADPYGLAWAALDAGQRLGVPVVAFCHSDLPRLAQRWAGGQGHRASLARRAAAAYLRRLYRRFDLVLAPSTAMTHDLLDLGVAQARHQPLGVDTTVFHPGLRDAAWRRRLGLPPQARLLLYTGRLAPEKNLPVLVAAVQRLGPPYVLLLVGHGPAAPPPSDRVRVLPHVREDAALARIVASADLFVHAGDQETFGLSMLEAMACGTPVMVRAAGGLAELAAGGAGIGLPDNRPDTWAQALAAWFGDAPGRPRTGTVPGLALARARGHDWQVLLPQWLARTTHLCQVHDPWPHEASTGADERQTTEPGVSWH